MKCCKLWYFIWVFTVCQTVSLQVSSSRQTASQPQNTELGTVDCTSFFDLCSVSKDRRPFKVRKGAKIRNRYNQAPHLTQENNGKVTTSQLDITNESQEVSPFPEGDHKASINRHARKHNKNKT